MGRGLCRYHGKAGMILVCEHINRGLLKRARIPDVSRITFIDHETSDERFRICEVIYYCPVCVSEKGLPVENQEMPTQEFPAIHGKLGGLPVCFPCFSELTA